MRRRSALTALALWSPLLGVAQAQVEPGDPPASHARARLVSDAAALAPGAEATLAVSFEIDPGWHLYWDGLNDSGLPPRVRLTLPDGFTAGEVRWPAPVRHVTPGAILDHIYERRLVLLVPLHVPKEASIGADAAITAEVDWLVCKNVCLPESAHLSISIPVRPAAAPSKDAALVREASARLPRPIAEAKGRVSLVVADTAATFRAAGAVRMAFYPGAPGIAPANPIADCEARADRMEVPLKKSPDPDARFRGILAVWLNEKDEPSVWLVDEALAAPEGAVQPATPGVPPAGGG